jgi:hypothetical protein
MWTDNETQLTLSFFELDMCGRDTCAGVLIATNGAGWR